MWYEYVHSLDRGTRTVGNVYRRFDNPIYMKLLWSARSVGQVPHRAPVHPPGQLPCAMRPSQAYVRVFADTSQLAALYGIAVDSATAADPYAVYVSQKLTFGDVLVVDATGGGDATVRTLGAPNALREPMDLAVGDGFTCVQFQTVLAPFPGCPFEGDRPITNPIYCWGAALRHLHQPAWQHSGVLAKAPDE